MFVRQHYKSFMRTICIIFLVIWGLSFALRLSAQIKFKRMNVAEFRQAIQQEDIQLIDVRTEKEYNQGHIENAIHMDVLLPSFKKDLVKLYKNKPIYLYCKSGRRSITALRILQKNGFENVCDLKGGFLAWEKE